MKQKLLDTLAVAIVLSVLIGLLGAFLWIVLTQDWGMHYLLMVSVGVPLLWLTTWAFRRVADKLIDEPH